MGAVFLLALIPGSVGQAQKATRWRGPDGNGIYSEKGLMKVWPEEGPEMLWSYESLGQGHSSPVASGDYVFTTGMTGDTGFLFKFDLQGNLVYRVEYGPEFSESYYGSRGSPVVAGDRVYIISGYGQVYGLRERDGEKIWTVDMVKDYGGTVLRWGYNETPVIDGDLIFCTPGGRKHNVVALNRQDGSLIWSCPGRGNLSAYCSPLLFSHGGRKILATHTASNFIGVDATSGEMLWSHSHPNEWSVHANTPIYRDGGLLFFSGYGKGAVKLELNEDGSKTGVAWRNESFDSRLGGAVLIEGILYSSGDYHREWMSVDWKTGKTLHTSTALAKGNVIWADGMLYCYSERGELALVKAGPNKFEVVSKTRVVKGSEQHWAHPAIHRGVLYLRHGKALIAYRIK
jgi:outer membrane protein assembly factor BamB